LLVLKALTVLGDRGHQAVQGLDLELRPGEILGLAGVAGNGQKELADALAGLRRVESGSVQLAGLDLRGLTPRRIIKAGLGYIPEDRHHEGIVPGFSIRENLVLKDVRSPRFSRRGFLRQKTIDGHALELQKRFDIRCAGIQVAAGGLSGGNIQKVILARELARNPRALVAVYPTRGLDLGAIEFIHHRLLELKRAGAAILLISEELDELLNLCDRIAVICGGRIVDTVPARSATRSSLGLLMTGLERVG
jgi:simple sugar transport system ATP-binding protein